MTHGPYISKLSAVVLCRYPLRKPQQRLRFMIQTCAKDRLSAGDSRRADGSSRFLSAANLVHRTSKRARAFGLAVTHITRLAAILALQSATFSNAAEGSRVTGDLRVLYTFDAASGDTVRDHSGVDPRLDLRIEERSAVEWREGSLVVRSATRINSSLATGIARR